MTPQPLQRKRTKGFKYPEGVRVLTVTRGTFYGNPFTEKPASIAVQKFRDYMEHMAIHAPVLYRTTMRGVWEADYIACWCPLDAPCHRSVLIELATNWAQEKGLTK